MPDQPKGLRTNIVLSERGEWILFGARTEGLDHVAHLASVATRLWRDAEEEGRQVFVRALTVMAAQGLAKHLGGPVDATADGEILLVARPPARPPAGNN